MEPQHLGSSAPQVASPEAAQTATEDTLDQFCWSFAQVLKRILGLAPTGAEDEGVDEQIPGG